MKVVTVTQYVAFDGKVFTAKAACEKYEKVYNEVQAIMKQLPKQPKDDGCSFANGHGYLQHDGYTLKAVRTQILDLALKYFPKGDYGNMKSWIQDARDGKNVHNSWPGRAINELCPAPIDDAWHR